MENDLTLYCRGVWVVSDENTIEPIETHCPIKSTCHRYKQRIKLELYTYFDIVPWSLKKFGDKAECRYYWEV